MGSADPTLAVARHGAVTALGSCVRTSDAAQQGVGVVRSGQRCEDPGRRRPERRSARRPAGPESPGRPGGGRRIAPVPRRASRRVARYPTRGHREREHGEGKVDQEGQVPAETADQEAADGRPDGGGALTGPGEHAASAAHCGPCGSRAADVQADPLAHGGAVPGHSRAREVVGSTPASAVTDASYVIDGNKKPGTHRSEGGRGVGDTDGTVALSHGAIGA
jgi:hypothetical protein